MTMIKIDDTREIIIFVADRLFSRFGFHKTSMDEIAKIARKAKGSIYYHFPSKEDLFREVVLKEISQLKNVLSLVLQNHIISSSDKLKEYVLTRMSVMELSLNYHETLKADFFEHYKFVDDLRNEFDAWDRTNLKNIINQGITDGEFSININIDILADVLIMILKGLEIPFFVQNRYKDYSTHFNDMFVILTRGLSKYFF